MAAFDSSEQHWARQRLAVLDEASVSIGRGLDLRRTAQELTELVVPRFADFASVDPFDEVLRGDDPAEADICEVPPRRVFPLVPRAARVAEKAGSCAARSQSRSGESRH
jgi:hypothetical protein